MKLSNCKLCHLHKTRTQVVMPSGSRRKAKIVFVGEAPGKNEDLQGKPFVGEAGKILDWMIAEMCLKKDVIYITNVIKCRPPKNRNPYQYEIEFCSHWLLKEMKLINKELIITLGNVALSSILGKTGIMNERGKMFYSPEWNSWVYTMLHPACLLYNRDENEKKMLEDINNFNDVVKNMPIYSDVCKFEWLEEEK